MLRWQVGNVRVTRVVELTTASIGSHIIPAATPDELRKMTWLAPFLDEQMRPILSMHSLILESRDQTILVDTCIGNDKTRNYPKWHHMQSDFIKQLKIAGFETNRIDKVLCTHLHVDHVGWNTRLVDGQWQPTFTNAEYLFGKTEFDFWQTEEQEYGPVFEDSVAPIFDAGLAKLVSSSYEINDEIKLIPTPGHTPGHVSVQIQSQGEQAIITGDIVHHPCQLAHSDWCCTADNDETLARQTREAFIKSYCDEPVLIIGTHFTGPTAGKLVTDGDTVRLDY